MRKSRIIILLEAEIAKKEAIAKTSQLDYSEIITALKAAVEDVKRSSRK